METTIRISDEGLTTIEIEENGLKVEKIVKIEDLKKAFSTGTDYLSPLLPGKSGLLQYKVDGNNEKYAFVTEPRIYHAIHEIDEGYSSENFDKILEENLLTIESSEDDDDYFTLKTKAVAPYLLWLFDIRVGSSGNRTLVNSKVFTLKHEVLSLNDELCFVPLPNVFDHNEICWGGSNPVITTERSIHSLPEVFFNSPSNTDLEYTRFIENSVDYFLPNGLRRPTDYLLHCGVSLKENYSMQDILEETIPYLRLKDRTIGRELQSFFR